MVLKKEVSAIFGFKRTAGLSTSCYIEQEYKSVPDILGRQRDNRHAIACLLGPFPKLSQYLPLGSIVRIEFKKDGYYSYFFRDMIVIQQKEDRYKVRPLIAFSYDKAEIWIEDRYLRVIALGDGTVSYGVDFELSESEKQVIAWEILNDELNKGKVLNL